MRIRRTIPEVSKPWRTFASHPISQEIDHVFLTPHQWKSVCRPQGPAWKSQSLVAETRPAADPGTHGAASDDVRQRDRDDPRSRLPPAPAPTPTAMPDSVSQINLTWTAVSGATYRVEEYIPAHVEPLPAAGPSAVKSVAAAWKQIANLGSNVTSYLVSNLLAKQTYTFRVDAQASRLGYSNQASSTTGVNPTASTAYSNVDGTLFGKTGRPSYLDVEQGGVGDCWLMASLAEVAARDPSGIYQHVLYPFRDRPWRAEATRRRCTTSASFDASGTGPNTSPWTRNSPAAARSHDKPVNGVLWVALAEKAYVEANAAGYVTTYDVGDDNYGALDDGVSLTEARSIPPPKAAIPSPTQAAMRNGHCKPSQGSSPANLPSTPPTLPAA